MCKNKARAFSSAEMKRLGRTAVRDLNHRLSQSLTSTPMSSEAPAATTVQQTTTSAYQQPMYNVVQPQGASYVPPEFQPQVSMDPESIKHQKTQSLSMLDSQLNMAVQTCKSDYEQAKQQISLRANFDLQTAVGAVEQSRQQALFALDQQHQQRRMEIEQRAQEQRMQIESTASQLCMQAQQQKLQKEMSDRIAKLQKEQADREAKAQMTMPSLPQQTTVTGSYVPPAQYSTISALMPQPIYANADGGVTTNYSTVGNISSYPGSYTGNFSSYPANYGGIPGYSGQPQVIRTVRVVSDTQSAQPATTTTVSS